ncbi:hypothetical protein TKWG_17000 [Advenella kashmirensis WT001]|uniref:Uncharacterized protein n=1 Tax=Advenella kashmirensis (strain DSM 17095 / LMG 22695 / WT001) TaxID=1036672 RepID=I3UE82_ADVKW|nr:hypothetical protein TKWG_17000 [Advenella kashmirensis WT001]
MKSHANLLRQLCRMCSPGVSRGHQPVVYVNSVNGFFCCAAIWLAATSSMAESAPPLTPIAILPASIVPRTACKAQEA